MSEIAYDSTITTTGGDGIVAVLDIISGSFDPSRELKDANHFGDTDHFKRRQPGWAEASGTFTGWLQSGQIIPITDAIITESAALATFNLKVRAGQVTPYNFPGYLENLSIPIQKGEFIVVTGTYRSSGIIVAGG